AHSDPCRDGQRRGDLVVGGRWREHDDGAGGRRGERGLDGGRVVGAGAGAGGAVVADVDDVGVGELDAGAEVVVDPARLATPGAVEGVEYVDPVGGAEVDFRAGVG